jgi:chaperonin cofactor prefoldin
MNKSVTEKLRSDHIDLLQRLQRLENENEALKSRLQGFDSDLMKETPANVGHEAVVEETAIREEDRISGILREKDVLIDSLKKELSRLQAECKTIRASSEIKLSKYQKLLEVSVSFLLSN